jgi:hypothetical protein
VNDNIWWDLQQLMSHFEHRQNAQQSQRFNVEDKDIIDAEFEEIKDEHKSNQDNQQA